MRCSYCGNTYMNNDPSCAGCGSPKTARIAPAYSSTDQLYVTVGHALMTAEQGKSRAILEGILGSPQKPPKQLWVERSAKIALVLGILYIFPMIGYVAVAMVMPFLFTIYLPYKGLKSLFSWIAGTAPHR